MVRADLGEGNTAALGHHSVWTELRAVGYVLTIVSVTIDLSASYLSSSLCAARTVSVNSAKGYEGVPDDDGDKDYEETDKQHRDPASTAQSP